jgi:hypothetical protein
MKGHPSPVAQAQELAGHRCRPAETRLLKATFRTSKITWTLLVQTSH